MLAIVFRNGIARRIPTFAIFQCWAIPSDLVGQYFYNFAPRHYFRFWEVNSTIDTVLEFVVLVDLARLAVSRFPVGVRRGLVVVLSSFLIAGGLIIWRVSDLWTITSVPREWHLVLQIQGTSSVLRILFLGAIAALTQFLSEHLGPLGWGDRELQVATGLVVYSLGAMIGTLLHTYSIPRWLFHDADLMEPVTYWCVLVYWIFSFLRPERNPARKKAPPERPAGQLTGHRDNRENHPNSGTLADA